MPGALTFFLRNIVNLLEEAFMLSLTLESGSERKDGKREKDNSIATLDNSACLHIQFPWITFNKMYKKLSEK